MLLYTETNDGYRIIASSQGAIVAGPTPELAHFTFHFSLFT